MKKRKSKSAIQSYGTKSFRLHLQVVQLSTNILGTMRLSTNGTIRNIRGEKFLKKPYENILPSTQKKELVPAFS
jgi:hypothetical protein